MKYLVLNAIRIGLWASAGMGTISFLAYVFILFEGFAYGLVK